MEWESDSPCHSHTYPGQGHRSSGRHGSWEVEFRNYGAIPGWGLLLTEERWIEGMWGGRLWWKMPVEESQVAMEPRWYCWVTRRGWSYHHSLSFPWQASFSSWTIERLAHRVPEALNYRVGPQSRGDPLCAWMGGATDKDWPKRPSDLIASYWRLEKRLW